MSPSPRPSHGCYGWCVDPMPIAVAAPSAGADHQHRRRCYIRCRRHRLLLPLRLLLRACVLCGVGRALVGRCWLAWLQLLEC